MPVAAVAGAVFAGAELVAGGLTIFQTIAAVGAITAGVGAVTGDQDLMKIGGIAGLAGGVGMFAQNQGWLNSTQAVAESGSNTASFIGEAAPGVEQVSPTVDTGAAIQNASDAGNTAMTGDSLLAADLAETAGNITQGITQPAIPTNGLINTSPNATPLDMRLAGTAGATKDTSIFQSTEFVISSTFTARDDCASMAHTLTSRCSNTSDVRHYRFSHVSFDISSRFFFSSTTDFTDHDDRFSLWIFLE